MNSKIRHRTLVEESYGNGNHNIQTMHTMEWGNWLDSKYEIQLHELIRENWFFINFYVVFTFLVQFLFGCCAIFLNEMGKLFLLLLFPWVASECMQKKSKANKNFNLFEWMMSKGGLTEVWKLRCLNPIERFCVAENFSFFWKAKFFEKFDWLKLFFNRMNNKLCTFHFYFIVKQMNVNALNFICNLIKDVSTL